MKDKFTLENLEEWLNSLEIPEPKNKIVALMNYNGATLLAKTFYERMNKELTEEHLQIILNRIPFDSYGYCTSDDVWNNL